MPQVVKEARYRSLPPENLAGQIHQESGWDSSAASSYAKGLAQFTPATEEWINSQFPQELKNGGGSLDPRWAIRAMGLYDRWLLDRLAQEGRNKKGPAQPAEQGLYEPGRESPSRGQDYPSALRAYNGGLGWIIRERSCAQTPPLSSPYQGEVQGGFECCRRFRSATACKENLAYPERILNILAPMYRAVINPFGGGSGA